MTLFYADDNNLFNIREILKNVIFCVLPETWENETFTFKDVL